MLVAMSRFRAYINSLHIEWRELRVFLLLIVLAIIATVIVRTYRASSLEYIDVAPTNIINPPKPEPPPKETPEEILGPSFFVL